MAYLNTGIFFNSGAVVGGLFFDGKIAEKHNYSATTTKIPIEAGANITDNAYVNPDIVELNVFVGSMVFSLSSFGAASGYNLLGRTQDALSKLKQLMANLQPLSVICNLAYYPALMLIDIDVNQDKTNNTTLVAKLSFEQIIVIDQTSGSLNNGNTISNNDPQYQPPANRGTKQGITA